MNDGLPWPALFAVFAAALLGGCAWFERSMIYLPSRELAAGPGALGLTYEELELSAADGPRVHGWFVPLEPHSPVVLLCHGNGGNISHRLEKLKLLRQAGASVLLFDYRGYGKSTGTPTEQGTYLDADSAYLWLTETRGVAPTRIVLYGESLGAGVAAELALRRPAAGLVLDSGFTSTVEMGRRIFPWLPVRWIVRFKYDTLSKLPRVKTPVLVLHSPQDEIIPYEMGRRLFEAAAQPKTFSPLIGGHNDGFLVAGPAYVDALARFLTSHARR